MDATKLRNISLYYYQRRVMEMIIYFSMIYCFPILTYLTYSYSILDDSDERIILLTFMITITVSLLVSIMTITAFIYTERLKFKIKISDGFDNFGLAVGDNTRNRYAFKNFFTFSLLKDDDLNYFSSDSYYMYQDRIIGVLERNADSFIPYGINAKKKDIVYKYDITK